MVRYVQVGLMVGMWCGLGAGLRACGGEVSSQQSVIPNDKLVARLQEQLNTPDGMIKHVRDLHEAQRREAQAAGMSGLQPDVSHKGIKVKSLEIRKRERDDESRKVAWHVCYELDLPPGVAGNYVIGATAIGSHQDDGLVFSDTEPHVAQPTRGTTRLVGEMRPIAISNRPGVYRLTVAMFVYDPKPDKIVVLDARVAENAVDKAEVSNVSSGQ